MISYVPNFHEYGAFSAESMSLAGFPLKLQAKVGALSGKGVHC